MIDFISQNKEVLISSGFAVLWGISEILGASKKIQANGVFQAIRNGLVWFGETFLTKK